MNFSETIIYRLRNAQTSELPQLRAEYDAYLATLDDDGQQQVISRVEPVLRELMQQSANRLDEAVTVYLSRGQKQLLTQQ